MLKDLLCLMPTVHVLVPGLQYRLIAMYNCQCGLNWYCLKSPTRSRCRSTKIYEEES